MDHPIRRSRYSQTIPCIAAPTPPSPKCQPAEREGLADLGIPRWSFQTPLYCNGMGILIAKIGGWMAGTFYVCKI